MNHTSIIFNRGNTNDDSYDPSRNYSIFNFIELLKGKTHD